MAYSLRALLGHLDTLEAVSQQNQFAVVIPLEQDIGMIPITEALHESLEGRDPVSIWQPLMLAGLSQSILNYALAASSGGRIAYVEAEYFSGEGYQAAVVWQDEKEIMGPFLAYKLPIRDKPINRVLRLLGVQINDAMDEFDTLGLGACRRTDDWISQLSNDS